MSDNGRTSAFEPYYQEGDATESLTGCADPHYIVCDRCSFLWDIEADWPVKTRETIVCPNCDHMALWRFPALEAARQLARQIQHPEAFA